MNNATEKHVDLGLVFFLGDTYDEKTLRAAYEFARLESLKKNKARKK